MAVSREEGVLSERVVPGPSLYYVARLVTNPRAVIGFLHGYADHIGRYEHAFDAWAEAGISVVGIDLRGHGRAEGLRGYCERFPEFLDDAAELHALLRRRVPSAPAFLMGHSFGGLVAASAMLETPRDYEGLLLSAPYLGLAMQVPLLKIKAAEVASKIWPKLGIPSGLQGADVARDPERARAYDSDPLGFKKATARWFTETREAQARAIANAPRLSLPLYVVFGGTDKVARLSDAKRFFDQAGSKDKTWDERPDVYHEPFSEPDWRSVADTVRDWIFARAVSPTKSAATLDR